VVEGDAEEAAPLSTAKEISGRTKSACLRFFLNAVLKGIFADYPIRFIAESSAQSVRFPRIHDRPAAGSSPETRMIGGFASGDYRVIYEIADTDQIVRINRVRHRKEVYR
jgi:hypothetical protein